MFTPRKVAALEPKIREFTAGCLDPLIGTGRFDFVDDLGAQMPMQVIGMLLGIPEAGPGQSSATTADANLRTEAGKPMRTADAASPRARSFAAYIDWRAEHPSDDIMTELLNAEFADETGHSAAAHPRRAADRTCNGRRRRGQRDDDPADRLGGQGAR